MIAVLASAVCRVLIGCCIVQFMLSPNWTASRSGLFVDLLALVHVGFAVGRKGKSPLIRFVSLELFFAGESLSLCPSVPLSLFQSSLSHTPLSISALQLSLPPFLPPHLPLSFPPPPAPYPHLQAPTRPLSCLPCVIRACLHLH